MIELAFVSRPLMSHPQFSLSKGKGKSKAKFAYGGGLLLWSKWRRRRAWWRGQGASRWWSGSIRTRRSPCRYPQLQNSKRNNRKKQSFWVYFLKLVASWKNWQRHKHPSSAGPPNWGATLVLMMAGSNILLFSSDTFLGGFVFFFLCLVSDLLLSGGPAPNCLAKWPSQWLLYTHITWTLAAGHRPGWIEQQLTRGRVSTSNVFCWLFENVRVPLVAMPTTHTHIIRQRERERLAINK